MILIWLLEPFVDAATWVVQQFPVIDMAQITTAVSPLWRLIAWGWKLNEGIPIAEGFAALGVLLAVWTLLYGVMTVRRIWSLFWPGSGS